MGNNYNKSANKNVKRNTNRKNFPREKGKYENSKNVRDVDSKDKPCVRGRFNDPAWYTKIPTAAQSALKGFTHPTGKPFTAKSLGLDPNSTLYNSYPGICVLHYIPAVGKTVDGLQSPIDKAANKIWMEFRTKNTGAITYDAPDIILNLVAGVNIHAFYYDMTRLYGLLHNSMITKNTYIPKDVITALGYSYNSFMDNLAEFGIWINTISNYINSSVSIPKSFSLYDRYVFMNAGIYKDEDLEKFQMYAFKCDGYYIFNERIEGEAGKLEFKAMPTEATFTDVKEYFELMWNRYALSESMADIQSGYYKYFGTNFHQLPYIDLNYIVEPLYSSEMLSQIQNVVFVGPVNEEDTYIGQDTDTGFVDANYGISGTGLSDVLPEGVIVNMFKDIPTPEDILEATRGISFCYGLSSSGNTIQNREIDKYISTCGSEIFTKMDLYAYGGGDDAYPLTMWSIKDLTSHSVAYRLDLGSGSSISNTFAYVDVLLDSFSYHPTLYTMSYNADGDKMGTILCDIANAVVMTEEEISRINELVIISQFTIF